jgi:RNA polymerase sigma-70 factor (ECF subfamily)
MIRGRMLGFHQPANRSCWMIRIDCSGTNLNRAVAVAMAMGPEYGLEIIDLISHELEEYRWMHSTRAELLRKLGRNEEAGDAYRRALSLTENSAERSLLSKRLSKTEDTPGHNS